MLCARNEMCVHDELAVSVQPVNNMYVQKTAVVLIRYGYGDMCIQKAMVVLVRLGDADKYRYRCEQCCYAVAVEYGVRYKCWLRLYLVGTT